jgi:glycosyltransferase involved in cell wall biosynthesis
MKISIAMATYNGAKYLLEQLESFVNQERQPDELVVCDDGSTDDTLSILKKFSTSAPFIVKIFANEKQLGYGQNFGRALSLCTGDLIFLSDQDDVWLKDKIQTVVDLAKRNSHAQLFMNDAEIVGRDLVSTGLTKLGQIRSAGLPDSNFVMGCCMAIRKDFLKYLLPVPCQFKGHDDWLSIFGEGLQCRRVFEQPLQLYRRHEKNTSNNLVNNTKKLNRVDLWISKSQLFWDSTITKSSANALGQYIERTEIVIERANLWIEKTNDAHLKTNLITLVNSENEILSLLNQRVEIRSKNPLSRVFQSLIFFLNGKYKKFSGFNSCIRDILYRAT